MTTLSRTSKGLGLAGTAAAHGVILLLCIFAVTSAAPTPLPPPVEALRITLSEPVAVPAPLVAAAPEPEPEPVREPSPPEDDTVAVNKKEPEKPREEKPRKARPKPVAPKPVARTEKAETPDSGPTRMAKAAEEARQTLLSALVARIEREKRYPTAARRLGLEGQVVAVVEVDARGRIISVRAQGRQQTHAVLEKATLDALHRVRDGWSPMPVPRAMTLTIPVRYSLRNS